MRVLVTGATGRVGSVVVRALLQKGEAVRALAFEGDPALSRLQGLDVEIVLGDLASGRNLEQACAGVDAVIHLGALMAWTRDDWPQLFDINVRGTFNLLQAMAGQPAKLHRLVLASTDASYPASAPLYAPVDEHHPQVPNTFYGMTKQVTEAMALFYGRDRGLPVARARFAFTLAPEELLDPANPHCGHVFYLSARLRRLRARRPMTAATQQMISLFESLQPADGAERIVIPYGEDGTPWVYTLCHVRDLVSGILLLLYRPEAVGDVFNLGPAAPFAMDVALKYLSQASGVPYVEVRLPGAAQSYTISIAKARSMLGYAPQHSIFDMIDEATGASRA